MFPGGISLLRVAKMNNLNRGDSGMLSEVSMYPIVYSDEKNVFILPPAIDGRRGRVSTQHDIEIETQLKRNIQEAGNIQVQKSSEINYKKKNFTFEEFERILSRNFKYNRIGENCYLINGKRVENGEKIIPQKSFSFIPYCLKPLQCKHRLDYDCHNFEQELCKNCNAKKLMDYYESRGIPYYHVVRDDEDIPRAIKQYNEQFGDFEAVIVVACPRAVLENKRFIQKYNIPVIFVSLAGWHDCNIKKALQGKWWGETSFDLSGLQHACNKCLTEKGGKNHE